MKLTHDNMVMIADHLVSFIFVFFGVLILVFLQDIGLIILTGDDVPIIYQLTFIILVLMGMFLLVTGISRVLRNTPCC